MPDDQGGVSAERLRSFVKRIEKLEEERKETAHKAAEGFLAHLFPTWLLRLIRA